MTNETALSITATNIVAAYYVVAGIKIDVKTGEVSIPDGMEISEASRLFWESLKLHA